MKKTYLLLVLGALLSTHVQAQPTETLLLREPALGRDKVAFSYAGDLWTANHDGFNPQRLTVGPGVETNPYFSPDGQWIAYTGDYDNNPDVYVIATTGGQPRRLTWHPGADEVRGWSPDGKLILFNGAQEIYSRAYHLLTVPLAGGFPVRLPLPMAEKGCYSPDGARLAYTPIEDAFRTWKRYRGGQTTPIWLVDLKTLDVEAVPHENASDTSPIWLGGNVYFLSDRNRTMNVFEYNTSTKQVRQLTQHTDYDVKALNGHGTDLVYEQAGRLHLLNTANGQSNTLKISISPELLALRPGYRNVTKFIREISASPTGVRALIEARGDIFTVPVKKGDIRNLTRTDNVHERFPAWSPDGSRIAYFSDASGEYQLMIQDQKGVSTPGEKPAEAISLGGASFYFYPKWSPDGKGICYTDKRLNLWYIDLATKKTTKVATDAYGPILDQPALEPAWSPDSKWLTYTQLMDNHLRTVFVHELATGKSHAVSDGRGDAISPTFSRDGKYLFFAASTNVGLRTAWLDMSSYDRTVKRNLYVVVLSAKDPSPFAPESDEETVKKDSATTAPATVAKKAAKKGASGKVDEPKKTDSAVVKVVIDLAKIDQRILSVPAPAGDLRTLQAAADGKLFYLETPPTASGEATVNLHRFDLKERKDEVFLSGIQGFDLSADGKKLVYSAPKDVYGIVEAGGKLSPTEGKLTLMALDAYIDPRHEWKQMFNEVWRLERDYFYVPNMHGLDWAAIKKKYESFLPHVAHRADLNYLFAELMGEMVVGHNYVRGGDMPEMKSAPVGLLGADYEMANGQYRFRTIFNGENFNPDLRAPLTEPGVNVKPGEYLLAVNGRPLRSTDNVHSFFENTVGKQVTLTVNSQPNETGARQVTVVPIANELSLRRMAWVEGNRRKVDQLTGGRVAYVYLPNTSSQGYEFFNRYYFSQLDKEAVIIDERFNGGGFVADYIIDLLNRPLLSYWAPREGKAFTSPGASIYGPKVMLVNEYAGSGGDALPAFFRRRGLGTIVGKRTWGGLVGISGYPTLIDGGSVTSPSFAIYSPDGKWEFENVGGAPDVEVEMYPKTTQNNADPQLDRAVEVIMSELKKTNFKTLPIPAAPNRVTE
ncbi:MAG: PDZ domain-containing protein [Cytophagaceae bacterium]|nr:PDZ domain-containing protein [Cytophagaceae bacterium]